MFLFDLNINVLDYIFSYLKNYSPILRLVNKNWKNRFPKYKNESKIFLDEIINGTYINTLKKYILIIYVPLLLEKVI